MNHAPMTRDGLSKVDWRLVRPIYKKLSDEFHVLTDAYKLTLDDEHKNMLDHLIISIDEVDRCVDALPYREQRDGITKALIDFLGDTNSSFSHPLSPASLCHQMEILKQVIDHLEIKSEFIDAAIKIFLYTELKRHTEKKEELIKYIMLEGRATAWLPLSVMQVKNTHPFAQFFESLCSLMGIADLIIDAKEDYKLGYLQLRPNLFLVLHLNYILIRDGLLVWVKFPRKFQFTMYCIRFAWALITNRD